MGREHKGLAIYAWVILDNHLHAILAAPDLSAVLRDLKSFTARQLVQQIQVERREWLLHPLHAGCAANVAVRTGAVEGGGEAELRGQGRAQAGAWA